MIDAREIGEAFAASCNLRRQKFRSPRSGEDAPFGFDLVGVAETSFVHDE